MKRVLIIVLLLISMGLVWNCSKVEKTKKNQMKPTLETERDKESYAAGFRNGIQLYGMVKNNDIDFEVAMRGIRDAVNEEPQIPKAEMTKIYSRFKDKLVKRQEERQKAEAERNKKEGEAFLKANAGKEGVFVTNSKLQYQILMEGNGPAPQETDIVLVHYRCFLVDGREIANTRMDENGQPVRLPVGRSLPFWKEGLPLMKVGARFRLFVPSDLAYMEYGNPPLIGANAALVYEIELIGIEQ